MAKIKVWLKKPGEPPKHGLITNSLGALQAKVQGYIETVTIADFLVVICNEEGRIRKLPYNCDICGWDFYGTIIIAGVDGPEFADCPLSEDQMKKLFPDLWEVES